MSFEFYRLRNGVRVVLVPMAGVESTAVGVYVGTGSRFETPRINGISHFLEHMAFKGTKKFPTHKDTSCLEGLGAIQNAWTDVDATCYWTKIPAEYWNKGLELVADLALNPTIPVKDLEIERGVVLEEINRRDDRPDEIAGEVLMEEMFAPNGLGMTVLGEQAVIRRLTREEFLTYHRRQYQAGRVVVAVAGKMNLGQCRNQIEAIFGELPAGRGEPAVRYVDGQKAPQIKVEPKKLAAQAHVEVGLRGVTNSDPRRFALGLLTTYLGRGMSSRLFLELREKRGLCYAVHADEARWEDTGVWSVYAGVGLDKLTAAVEGVLEELKRVKSETVGTGELAQAKEKVRGPLLFSMENPVNQMEWYARQTLDRPEEILTHKEVIDRMMQIDAEEMQKVAQVIFLSEKLNLAVVGPVGPEKEEELLKMLSEWKP